MLLHSLRNYTLVVVYDSFGHIQHRDRHIRGSGYDLWGPAYHSQNNVHRGLHRRILILLQTCLTYDGVEGAPGPSSKQGEPAHFHTEAPLSSRDEADMLGWSHCVSCSP